MKHSFKFYIVYPMPLRDCTIETNHECFTHLVDSFKDKYEIKKECRKEVICGEVHAFLSAYACADQSRFLIGWIDETIC